MCPLPPVSYAYDNYSGVKAAAANAKSGNMSIVMGLTR